MLNQIVFEYPLVLLIIPVFMICDLFCKPKKRKLIFPNTNLLKRATKKSRYVEMILKYLVITLFSVALASPVIENDVVIKNDKGYEISLILDASGSMAEGDKFGIVKEIVSDFLKKRVHDKIALSIFADFAYVAVPLTYDKKSIKRLLDRLQVGVAGRQRTALYEALFLSSNLFKNSKAKHKIAILLTDGVNNVDTIPLNVAIKRVQKYGIKVYTIGIGQRGEYNPYDLQKIAKSTGGKFFEADSVQKLKEVYNTIDKLEKSEIKANKYIKKDYLFVYPLFVGFLLLLLLIFVRNKEVA